MRFKEFLIGWGEQTFIACDQWVNAVIAPVFSFRVGWADETLSARTYRAAANGAIFAKLVQPAINLLFIWQKPDAEINAVAGKVIAGHCERAFWKEKLRRNSPPDERN